jgi:hypothetical protein
MLVESAGHMELQRLAADAKGLKAACSRMRVLPVHWILTLLMLLIAPSLSADEGIRIIERRPSGQVCVHWQARADSSGIKLRLYRGATLTNLDLVAETETSEGPGRYQHRLPDLAEQAVFYQLRVVMPNGREHVLETVLAVVEHLLPNTTPELVDSQHLPAVQPAGPSPVKLGSTILEPVAGPANKWDRPPPPPPPPRSC